VEGKLFVTEEAPPIERPDWFPQGRELEEWADLIAHPRENADKLRKLGIVGGNDAAVAASTGGGARY
jgi:hypothetical protein